MKIPTAHWITDIFISACTFHPGENVPPGNAVFPLLFAKFSFSDRNHDCLWICRFYNVNRFFWGKWASHCLKHFRLPLEPHQEESIFVWPNLIQYIGTLKGLHLSSCSAFSKPFTLWGKEMKMKQKFLNKKKKVILLGFHKALRIFIQLQWITYVTKSQRHVVLV